MEEVDVPPELRGGLVAERKRQDARIQPRRRQDARSQARTRQDARIHLRVFHSTRIQPRRAMTADTAEEMPSHEHEALHVGTRQDATLHPRKRHTPHQNTAEEAPTVSAGGNKQGIWNLKLQICNLNFKRPLQTDRRPR